MFDSNITRALMLVEKILLIALLGGLILYDQSTNLLLLQIALGLLAITYFLFPYFTSTNRFIDIDLDELDNNDEEIDKLQDAQYVFSSLILPKILWLSTAVSIAGYLALLTFQDNDTYRKLILVGGGTILVSLSIFAYDLFKGFRDIHFLYPILLRAIPVTLFDLYLLFYLLK